MGRYPMPLPESDEFQLRAGDSPKSPSNQGRRDEISHPATFRRTILFQMKCRLKMSWPAVLSGFNRAGVHFRSFPVGTLGWVSTAI
jgi:hypothetical protein